MPLYEYHCDFCGKNFEKLQKFSDQPLTVHDECGKGPVERLISVSALQFKGSGFYITDYKKGNSSSPSKDGKSDGGGSSASSESKDSGSKSSDNSGGESKSAPAPAATPSSSESK